MSTQKGVRYALTLLPVVNGEHSIRMSCITRGRLKFLRDVVCTQSEYEGVKTEITARTPAKFFEQFCIKYARGKDFEQYSQEWES